MEQENSAKLLGDRRVVEEINRHLWIESEKAGYDIGFDKAKEDWLKNFSKAWMKYHMPEKSSQASKPSENKTAKTKSQKGVAVKRRRAKSYVKK